MKIVSFVIVIVLTNSKPKVSPAGSTDNPPSAASNGDSQFVVTVSEGQIKVTGLPSQITPFKSKLGPETSGTAIRAEIVTVSGSAVIICYTNSCKIQTFSLPSLRCLFDVTLLPTADLRSVTPNRYVI